MRDQVCITAPRRIFGNTGKEQKRRQEGGVQKVKGREGEEQRREAPGHSLSEGEPKKKGTTRKGYARGDSGGGRPRFFRCGCKLIVFSAAAIE